MQNKKLNIYTAVLNSMLQFWHKFSENIIFDLWPVSPLTFDLDAQNLMISIRIIDNDWCRKFFDNPFLF